MIINLRGANGSGKSTIVRAVMERFDKKPTMRQGRRQPIGYICTNGSTKLHVVGHYEIDCGGCDTITQLDDVYNEVHSAAKHGYHVLYEGIMVSGEYRRCVELHKEFQNVLVLGLDVSLNECLEAVLKRRTERGDVRPFMPKRTVQRFREVQRNMEHLKICKVPAQWVSREKALDICLANFLGVSRDN